MNHTEEEIVPLAYSEQTIADYANGVRPMSARVARDIERRLGLRPGWLDRPLRRVRRNAAGTLRVG